MKKLKTILWCSLASIWWCVSRLKYFDECIGFCVYTLYTQTLTHIPEWSDHDVWDKLPHNIHQRWLDYVFVFVSDLLHGCGYCGLLISTRLVFNTPRAPQVLRECLHICWMTKQHHEVPLQVYNVLGVCEFCVCGNNSHSNVCTFFYLSIFKYMRDENKSSTNKWKNWNQEKPSYNKTTKVTSLNLRLSVLNLKTINFSSRVILLVGLSCELSVMPLIPLLPGVTEENVSRHCQRFPGLQNCPWLRTSFRIIYMEEPSWILFFSTYIYLFFFFSFK